MHKIIHVAKEIGLIDAELELYGVYKAKVQLEALLERERRPTGKLVLVTSITPTPAGEGKTVTSIGLAQAFEKIGKRCILCLREPSLGPNFGIKGGATGGGASRVLPADDINLHFTGDIHAITASHNLLAALVDNHIHHGNELRIDPRRILWPRALDLNDRALRHIVVGLAPEGGVPREDRFLITTASEVMAVLCLSQDYSDLKERLGKILVALNEKGEMVTARDLKAPGAMAALLKDAMKPNLVQTSEGTAAFVHGGPFANIAHGTNSIIATRLALKLGEIVIQEAGFGADLGAEKFIDIVCREGGFYPACAVIVVSCRALKMHGGVPKGNLERESAGAIRRGSSNLLKHVEIVKRLNINPVVAINRFPFDTDKEMLAVAEVCEKIGIPYAVSEVFAKGGKGGEELARVTCRVLEKPLPYRPLYELTMPIKDKISKIATEIYGASEVRYTQVAEKQLVRLGKTACANLPVCMAKTQYSLSDNPSLLGRPRRFTITVNEIRLSQGAGFLVVFCGDVMTMPGLPKIPVAERIDLDSQGNIVGLGD